MFISWYDHVLRNLPELSHMFVYMPIVLCQYVSIYKPVLSYGRICMYVYMYICMYVCMYVCMYCNMPVQPVFYICMYVTMCVCVYVCIMSVLSNCDKVISSVTCTCVCWHHSSMIFVYAHSCTCAKRQVKLVFPSLKRIMSVYRQLRNSSYIYTYIHRIMCICMYTFMYVCPLAW